MSSSNLIRTTCSIKEITLLPETFVKIIRSTIYEQLVGQAWASAGERQEGAFSRLAILKNDSFCKSNKKYCHAFGMQYL